MSSRTSDFRNIRSASARSLVRSVGSLVLVWLLGCGARGPNVTGRGLGSWAGGALCAPPPRGARSRAWLQSRTRVPLPSRPTRQSPRPLHAPPPKRKPSPARGCVVMNSCYTNYRNADPRPVHPSSSTEAIGTVRRCTGNANGEIRSARSRSAFARS